MKHQVDDSLFFYSLFQHSPDFAAAAGWIFEFRMHQLLQEGGPIELFPIVGARANTNFAWKDYKATVNGKNPMFLQLPPSEESPLVEQAELDVGHYYRPQANNFPAIDSLLLIHPPNESPILLMFQMTRDKDGHGINKCGLIKVDAFNLPPNTRKYYVVVTPYDIHPKIMASLSYLEDEDSGQAFSVFHYPVHEDAIFDKDKHN